MALVKYTGLSHYRQLLKTDFQKVGVEVKEALTFARHEIVDVADDVADALLELVGDEFEKVEHDVEEGVARKAAERPIPYSMPSEPAAEEDNTDEPTPSEQPPAGDSKSKA